MLPSDLYLTPVMASEMTHVAEYKEGESVDFIFEPNATTILDVLAPRYIRHKLWRIFLESNASEQGARMVAMDSATTNAGRDASQAPGIFSTTPSSLATRSAFSRRGPSTGEPAFQPIM